MYYDKEFVETVFNNASRMVSGATQVKDTLWEIDQVRNYRESAGIPCGFALKGVKSEYHEWCDTRAVFLHLQTRAYILLRDIESGDDDREKRSSDSFGIAMGDTWVEDINERRGIVEAMYNSHGEDWDEWVKEIRKVYGVSKGDIKRMYKWRAENMTEEELEEAYITN